MCDNATTLYGGYMFNAACTRVSHTGVGSCNCYQFRI